MAGALPGIVQNRSFQHVAFRASAWTSDNLEYVNRPVEDPNRSELLVLNIASKGRYEAWQAPIRRSAAGLPAIGAWELYGTEEDDPIGNLPYHIGAALAKRGASQGPTMPAADMVLGPWDVPHEFFPVTSESGPLDFARERTQSSFLVTYRPELPGPVIASQTFLFKAPEAPRGHIQGAMDVLIKAENTEFKGPQFGDECRYFEGKLAHLYRYTALWRYPGAICEVVLAGPPGRYTRKDVSRYAVIQDRRARAELDGRRIAS